MKIVFAYDLTDHGIVIDEARCDDGFMKFLRDEMHAKLTLEESGELTAPMHYHEVFEEIFQTLPYVLSDEEALKALGEEVVSYHKSQPPQHVA